MTSSNTEYTEVDIGDVIQSTTIFEWSIKNFSNRCRKNKDLILSPVFSHGNNMEFSWRLGLYPYGREDNNGRIFLNLRKANRFNVKASFVLSIINMHNSKKSAEEMLFKFNEIYWGFYFMGRNEVIESIKHLDDVLTIRCEILSADIINKSNNSRICNTKFNLFGDIGQLYINKNLSDAILRVDSKEFKVHKAILSARSKVFAAMFQHDMIEKSKNVVEIEDMNSKIMDAMLKFIYTGEVENIEETAKELLVAADRYAIEDLKEICISYLGRIINVDNAIDLLLYAESQNLDEFKTNMTDFIANNINEIICKPEFELIKNAPWEIIKDLICKLAVVSKKC